MERLIEFLRTLNPEQPSFPPTLLYNEGWLLRLALDWYGRNRTSGSPLSLVPGATWFSEALLPSPFRPRYRGDPLAESRTHADGVIGQIAVGQEGRADLQLSPEATQLVVLEAKLGSGLSAGTKNAPGYDQAARNVACMAEVLRRAARPPAQFSALGFYVLAPQSRIETGVFAAEMGRESILRKVEQRAQSYEDRHDAWFDEWFRPLLETIEIEVLSWERVLADVGEQSSAAGDSLTAFYELCLRFN
jgi:hypothetical protein